MDFLELLKIGTKLAHFISDFVCSKNVMKTAFSYRIPLNTMDGLPTFEMFSVVSENSCHCYLIQMEMNDETQKTSESAAHYFTHPCYISKVIMFAHYYISRTMA
jgi:formate-dependent nitrite reductase membrane component NrfD